MAKAYLSPYLNFKNQTEEAMNFYHSVLGGDLEMQKFSDVPGMEVEESKKDLIMHSTLKSDDLSFMASDAQPNSDLVVGTNVMLSIAGADVEKITGYFNGLAEGGTITTPLEKMFWGDTFGALTDKFGIHWIVNIGSTETGRED